MNLLPAQYKALKIVLLGAMLLLLTGCGSRTVKPEQPALTNAHDSLIAQDFVNIMLQIDELSPWSTVLSFTPQNLSKNSGNQKLVERGEMFGRALRSAAADSGYVLKTVQANDVPYLVKYSISHSTSGNEAMAYTYDLSVGDIDFRRVYMPQEGGGVQPHKSMMVRGADVGQLETDDSIFDKKPEESNLGLLVQSPSVEPAAPLANQAAPEFVAKSEARSLSSHNSFDSPLQPKEQTAIAQTVVPTSTDNANEQLTLTQAPVIPEPAKQTSLTETLSTPTSKVATADKIDELDLVGKANVADTGRSNFEVLLVDKQDVAEEVLIFGDDSYVLGMHNKQMLGLVMADFNPETDVISVIGCSTGDTKIKNGNPALAIGRANRVKEALLYSGVPHDKIFDEGCWSTEANSTPFPNRGVVVTVKRGAKTG